MFGRHRLSRELRYSTWDQHLSGSEVGYAQLHSQSALGLDKSLHTLLKKIIPPTHTSTPNKICPIEVSGSWSVLPMRSAGA